METYYDNKLVLKYGIVVFNIEPIVETIEKSKILLDIDIVIQHENGNNTGFENKSLYKWLEKLKVSKFIDSRSREEIIKNTKIKKEHIDKYFNAIISENADKFYTTVVKRYLSDSNKFVESMCLLPLYNGDIDYLITNNDDIVRQSIDLYLRDKVFTLAEFLFKVENDYKELIDYDILSVKLKKFEEISIEDIFFDTLKEDYKEFDNWYKRKKDEKAYVFESKNKIMGFLYLKIENQNEEYLDIEPRFLPKKRLKIGTFKINRSGFRLGERFLKIIIDNAMNNKVDEIYVTMFKDKREGVVHLREFMSHWGFKFHGYKVSGEIVLVKEMRLYDEEKDPKYNFPIIRNNPNYYFLPIDSKYHTDLFPDSILKNENMNLYKENLAHRYSIEKIYVTGLYSGPKPGDIVLIYRMGERFPKRYSSVITGFAIVQEIIKSKNLDEYLKICSNKSVFSKDNLKVLYEDKKWQLIVKLLNYKTLKKKISLSQLYKLKIVEENLGPRTFMKISSNDYDRIIKEGLVTENEKNTNIY
ncbi:PIN domain-containing protein [Haploplasma axanthum]|uniref:N-acetyltransferase domain-containing protein n=1 Tax=Haploplasma axanthum TaxID=29552 RepID=A0A449BBY5_HAPAX|nr:hypothetical protein [Haploplasma axanthum]VEU79961.1 Uncharacterised protein [Haploplasma axanthum]